ncbi:MAG: 6,7-dimethyl-8-ribityllumazine synthase [Gemmatimonadetes bacterium]|nr:6,7-dimethyl-8-ribityllumazine synthase [Gemmatimonadota bacterium]
MDGRGLRVALLCTRFHGEITETLLERCLATLADHGVQDDAAEVVRVPGAWELPQAAARIASLDRHDVIVAIGCVIRGDTPHFDYVAGEATRGLGEVARDYDRPVIFGVLTTDTEAQAWERAREDGQDKGRELGLAALEMSLLYRRLA